MLLHAGVGMPIEGAAQTAAENDQLLRRELAYHTGVLAYIYGYPRPSNWLPVPRGEFYIILRLYEPQDALLDGSYEIPPVEMTD